MIEILSTSSNPINWSSDFLLPLTGIKKLNKVRSYLFWNENSINDYKLIVTTDEKIVFKEDLKRKGYMIEHYVINNKQIYIFDISEWNKDIDLFMKGKYSLLSEDAKIMIQNYHIIKVNKMSVELLVVLYPDTPMPLLNNYTPIEYVSENYGIDIEDLMKIGEIGSLFDEEKETLVL